MTRASVATMMLALAACGLSAVRADGAPAPLPNLDYRYDAHWGGLDVGQVEIALKPDGGQGCYRYTNVSNPTGLVRALYGAPNQTSLFCVRDGRIQSRRFESSLPGDDKQSYTLDFDWDKHTVTDGKGQVRSIPDDAVDSFALQQAVRLWVLAHAGDASPPEAAFTMVDGKNLTHYRFRFSGHQKVDTPAGSFDTLLMERIDNPDKIGRFWLAPDRGYMPVRIETKNGGKPMVGMELAK
ncbi:MAG: DUF3108 domain-containing protein [Nevskia sp.]|nr:DUF3108 domain-containing protein [Nevskia sp.]